MREIPKDRIQKEFDATKAPQAECEFIAEIVSGGKRALSIPQAIDLHDALNQYPKQ